MAEVHFLSYDARHRPVALMHMALSVWAMRDGCHDFRPPRVVVFSGREITGPDLLLFDSYIGHEYRDRCER